MIGVKSYREVYVIGLQGITLVFSYLLSNIGYTLSGIFYTNSYKSYPKRCNYFDDLAREIIQSQTMVTGVQAKLSLDISFLPNEMKEHYKQEIAANVERLTAEI
jgi:hypothetical protein